MCWKTKTDNFEIKRPLSRFSFYFQNIDSQRGTWRVFKRNYFELATSFDRIRSQSGNYCRGKKGDERQHNKGHFFGYRMKIHTFGLTVANNGVSAFWPGTHNGIRRTKRISRRYAPAQQFIVFSINGHMWFVYAVSVFIVVHNDNNIVHDERAVTLAF